MAVRPISESADSLPWSGTEAAARGIAREAAAEQQMLVDTMSRLLTSIGDRQSHLAHQLASTLPTIAYGGDGVVQVADLASTPRARVHCLGTFRFYYDRAELEVWRSGKARSLFQYLVNHREHTIPREALIEAIWPDPEVRVPGTSLKVAAHALRQALAALGGGAEGPELRTEDAGYRLQGKRLWLDVEEFERCCAAGRQLEALGQPILAAPLYAHAVDLYDGDFLEESWDDWVLFRREGLKDQYLHALTRLADVAFQTEEYQSCIVRCMQLLAKDRCCEDAYRTLMVCHARLGQRGRVRRWYELCVRALRADLDAAPEPETERLFTRALGGTV